MAKRDQEKSEQRRTVREQRREAQRKQAARRQRRRALIWGAVALGLVGVIGWVAASSLRQPGDRITTLGRLHITQGTPHKGYNSNPPTSGPHWPSPAPWGVHTQPLPDEMLVHNLEHGGVWISYKDQNDSDLAGKLDDIAGRYQSKVIVTPRPQNDAPIAVAAWGRLLKLQRFDEARIFEFINRYRGKIGPEPNAP